MPFTEKMILQLQKPSLKAFAFKGEPTAEEIIILGDNFWDFPNATKRVLRDGTALYLVQREKKSPLYMGDLSSVLGDLDDVDELNAQIGALSMGGGKKRKSRKSRKSKKSKKSRKSKKSKKSRKEMLGWQKW